jgi:RNA polymerase sigma-70 factor (ECF subfamily)
MPMFEKFRLKINEPSKSQHSNDFAIVNQAYNGDENAAREIVCRLSPKAYALAWRMLENQAEAQDVMQEGFIKLLTVKQFNGNSSLSTYFHTIVLRLCLNRLKSDRLSRNTFNIESQNEIEDSAQNPYNDFQKSEYRSIIQKAMMSINPRQRAALTLWAYQDASVQEISEILEIESNAANQLLHRAKINLKLKILELGYEQ